MRLNCLLFCDAQILGGLLPEVKALQGAGFTTGSHSAISAIGYRQTVLWLERIKEARHASASDVRQLAFDIQGPSRRLHRSQIILHRNVEQFHWVDATQGSAAAAEHIAKCFSLPEHEGVRNVA